MTIDCIGNLSLFGQLVAIINIISMYSQEKVLIYIGNVCINASARHGLFFLPTQRNHLRCWMWV